MSVSGDTELLILLTNLTNKVQKKLGGSLAAHGISFTEYLVLRELNQAPSKKLRRIDLADSIGMSASGVTRLLNPMQKIGLVQKEEAPRDARVSMVALTGTGEKVFREANRTFSENANEFLAKLGGQDKQTLGEIASALL